MLLNELQRQQQELAELAELRKEVAELRALVRSPDGQASSSRDINAVPGLAIGK